MCVAGNTLGETVSLATLDIAGDTKTNQDQFFCSTQGYEQVEVVSDSVNSFSLEKFQKQTMKKPTMILQGK